MIEIAGHKYVADKMTPREQLHVLRRLTPILAGFGDGIMALLDEGRDKAEVMRELAGAIGPLSQVLAFLPDEHVDYVMNVCLQNVRRMDTEAGSPVYRKVNDGKPILMFQDLDGMTELRLTAESVKVNLSGFFGQLSGASASLLSAQRAAQASTT